MPKKATNDLGTKALKAQLDRIAGSQARAFVERRIPSRVLIDRLGLPKSNLDTWWARKLFDLDVDRGRRDRLYSARDCVVLSVIYKLSGLGVPLAVGHTYGRGIAEYVVKNMKYVTAHRGRHSAAILFRRGKRPRSGSFTDQSEWDMEIYSPRAEVVSKHPPPALRIETDVEEFVREILENVMPGASGTDPRHRRRHVPFGSSSTARAIS